MSLQLRHSNSGVATGHRHSSGAGPEAAELRPSTIACAAESSISCPVTRILPARYPRRRSTEHAHDMRHMRRGKHRPYCHSPSARFRHSPAPARFSGWSELILTILMSHSRQWIEHRVIALLHKRRSGRPASPPIST